MYSTNIVEIGQIASDWTDGGFSIRIVIYVFNCGDGKFEEQSVHGECVSIYMEFILCVK